MPEIDEIRWTRQAHRQLGEWVAAFARDLDTLRLMRDLYRTEIEAVITAAGGYPAGRVEWGPPDTRIVEREFVARNLWITFTLRQRRTTFWELRGRRPGTVMIISALRRPRTPPERGALDS